VEWAGVLLLYLGGIAVRWLFEVTAPVPWKVWHGFLPVWFDLFALGFALALLSVRWSRGSGPPPFLRSTAGAAVCWAGAAAVYVLLALGLGLGRNPLDERTTGQALAEEVLWGLVAVLLALPAVAGAPRWLMVRPVALLGLVSYGIYLVHQGVVAVLLDHTGWDLFHAPLVSFGVVVLLVTVALAGLGYRFVERPGIAFGHRFRAPLQASREQLAGVSTSEVSATGPRR
jgi:peptidoglycan/LPS O-acetylase OafA/YrhL